VKDTPSTVDLLAVLCAAFLNLYLAAELVKFLAWFGQYTWP